MSLELFDDFCEKFPRFGCSYENNCIFKTIIKISKGLFVFDSIGHDKTLKMIDYKLFIFILIAARVASQDELYNGRTLSNQLNAHNFRQTVNNNDVFKDPNDDILAGAVEQMWRNGLKQLKSKIAVFGNRMNQRDSAEFAMTTICHTNGTCQIRQTFCNCDTTTDSRKECNDSGGLTVKNVDNKSENAQSNKKDTGNKWSKKQDSKTNNKGKPPVQTKKPAKKPTQTAKPAGGLSDAEVKTFRKQLLDQTNIYRSQHGEKKLTINEKMNVYAQEWANHLAKSPKLLEHRTERKYGENLFASSTKANLGKEAATNWYNEIFDAGGYNFKAKESQIASRFSTFGHMTQLLWKNSKEMGVGISKSPNGMYIVVANYNPPGNVIGQFKNNVFPKRKP